MSGEQVVAMCILEKTEACFYQEQHKHLVEALAAQASAVVQNAWLFDQLRTGRERLQALSHRLVEIQENERRYIARELHDEAGQALTSIMLGLQLLEKENNNRRGILSRIAQIKQTVDSVLENLHRLAVHLRPASLDHLGLIDAIQQYISSCAAGCIDIQFKVIGLEDKRLPVELETALYRIVQEALTNVIRHAHASRVDILLELREGRVVMVVEDDGIGYDAASAVQSGGMGLFGMQERAEMLGGSFEVETALGTGTTIVVEAPYDCANPYR